MNAIKLAFTVVSLFGFITGAAAFLFARLQNRSVVDNLFIGSTVSLILGVSIFKGLLGLTLAESIFQTLGAVTFGSTAAFVASLMILFALTD